MLVLSKETIYVSFNVTCIYFFIVKRKKILKSDVEFLKYIMIFSWHYVLPCPLHDDNI
jgi:hypothetical protein